MAPRTPTISVSQSTSPGEKPPITAKKAKSATAPTHDAHRNLSRSLTLITSRGDVSTATNDTPASTDDQIGPGEQESDPRHPARRQRLPVQPEEADPVEDHRSRQLAGDRRGGDRAGADLADQYERRENVGRSERAAEQVVPLDMDRFADAPRLAAQHHDRGEQDRSDREGDRCGGEVPGELAEPGVDRGLQCDAAADDRHDQDREAP